MSARILKLCLAGIFAVCLFSVGNIASAAPICPVPREVTQPDGTKITVTSYGDEFFCWHEDEEGNVIAYDEDTGTYQYAKIEDGKLRPAGELVGGASQSRYPAVKLQRKDIISLWENAERIDYSKSVGNDTRATSASLNAISQSQSPTKKLLTVLIEFNDVKLKYDEAFWAKQMYSTNPKDISVVNYWKENANGADVFEPSDTSQIQNESTGTVNYAGYADIRYTITKCSGGVVKVALDMPHPIKTWSDDSSKTEWTVEHMAIAAIEPYYDFAEQMPYMVFVFAGYEVPYGEGKGQMIARATQSGPTTPSGVYTNRTVIQGELYYNDIPAGIGITCHRKGAGQRTHHT